MSWQRCLVLFTKPARAGRVKTRLVGHLTAEQAAELHAAFLADLLARLDGGAFDLALAWALELHEAIPFSLPPGEPQRGTDLGARLFNSLAAKARTHAFVAAIGSDHPTLSRDLVEQAFTALEDGAEVVIGPAEDGGYYLIAVRTAALDAALFGGVDWSTERVLAQTLERCRELGLRWELLPIGRDVDTPGDLAALALDLTARPGECPRTRELLARWGRLESGTAV